MEVFQEYRDIELQIINDEIDTTDHLSMGIMYHNISLINERYCGITGKKNTYYDK